MSSNPGTIPEISPEICFQTDGSCDGTDTDHYMQPDVETSVEQLEPTPTNPRSSKYDLRHNLKPIVTTTTYFESAPPPSTERIRTLSGNPRNVLRN